jgi:hypothetical protein
MSKWFKRHWRDLAIVALFAIIALEWDDMLRDAYFRGAARCSWVPW